MVTLVSAVTVAVRGPPSRSEISPKKSPGPSFAAERSPIVTPAVPSVMRKNPMPDCPSRARTDPSRCVTSFAARAIWVSSDLESPSNRGTSPSSFTASALATSPPSGTLGDLADCSRGRAMSGKPVGPHMSRTVPIPALGGASLQPARGRVDQ